MSATHPASTSLAGPGDSHQQGHPRQLGGHRTNQFSSPHARMVGQPDQPTQHLQWCQGHKSGLSRQRADRLTHVRPATARLYGCMSPRLHVSTTARLSGYASTARHYGCTSPRLHVSQTARLCGTHRLHATTAARLHDGTSLRRHVSARVRRASPGPGQLIGGRPVSTERRPSHR